MSERVVYRKPKSKMPRCFVVACVVIVVIGSGGASRAAPGVERFEGTFVHAGSSKQGAEVIERAITRVTDDMGFLKEGVAYDRLDEALSVIPQIVIDSEGDRIRVDFQGTTYRSRVGGPWVNAKSPKGEDVDVRHRMKNKRLIQEIRTDKGVRRNVFVRTGKDTLRINVTISSPKLPEDIEYDLAYRRKK